MLHTSTASPVSQILKYTIAVEISHHRLIFLFLITRTVNVCEQFEMLAQYYVQNPFHVVCFRCILSVDWVHWHGLCSEWNFEFHEHQIIGHRSVVCYCYRNNIFIVRSRLCVYHLYTRAVQRFTDCRADVASFLIPVGYPDGFR